MGSFGTRQACRMPTTICCPRPAGSSDARSAGRDWPTSRPGCSVSAACPTAPAARSGQATAANPSEANALRRIASRLLIALGEVDRAEELWALGTRRASVDAAGAWIEVARIRERHRGDLRGAMDAAAAASRVLDIAFALGRGGSIAEVGRTRLTVERRLRRLRRWVAAAERRAAREHRRAAVA